MFGRSRKARSDFNSKFLPKTRKEAFFDILKMHYGLLLKLGLIILLFLVPLLLILINRDLYISKIYQEFKSNNIDENDFNTLYKSTYVFTSLLEIPAFILFGLGLSGVIKVYRRIIFYEPIFFKEDFFSGIKENILSVSVILLLFGLISLSTNIIRLNTDLFVVLRYLPYAVSYVLIYPTLLLSLTMLPIYNANVFSIIRDALKLLFKSFLKTILFAFLLFVVILITLISSIYAEYVLLLIYIVFVLPIFILAFYMNSTDVFDKYVNSEYHKEIYRKGLFD